jgi:hypothetical protein
MKTRWRLRLPLPPWKCRAATSTISVRRPDFSRDLAVAPFPEMSTQ